MSNYCVIAPIYYHNGDPINILSEPFDFQNGVRIGPSPSWLREDKIIQQLNTGQREHILNRSYNSIYSFYDLDNYTRRREILNKICQAILAIWLAEPYNISLEYYLCVEKKGDKWGVNYQNTLYQFIPQDYYNHGIIKNEQLEEARKYNLIIADLEKSGPVWTSLTTLYESLCVKPWDTRILLFWVILESLFGPEDPRETTFRLSQRISFFLSSDRKEARKLFDELKKYYRVRSKVVHGRRNKNMNYKETLQMRNNIEQFVRKSLIKILENESLIKHFNGKKREEYLDSLIFE